MKPAIDTEHGAPEVPISLPQVAGNTSGRLATTAAAALAAFGLANSAENLHAGVTVTWAAPTVHTGAGIDQGARHPGISRQYFDHAIQTSGGLR